MLLYRIFDHHPNRWSSWRYVHNGCVAKYAPVSKVNPDAGAYDVRLAGTPTEIELGAGLQQ